MRVRLSTYFYMYNSNYSLHVQIYHSYGKKPFIWEESIISGLILNNFSY